MNKKIRALSNARENAYGFKEDGKNYLVIERFRGEEKTEICAFCGDKHIHGKAQGHRIPHCTNTDYDYVAGRHVVFKNKNGELFDADDGYYVKNI